MTDRAYRRIQSVIVVDLYEDLGVGRTMIVHVLKRGWWDRLGVRL